MTAAPPRISLDAIGAAISAEIDSRSAPESGEPTPTPPAEDDRIEAAPTMIEAITTAVEKVLVGNHKATVEKRKALIEALSTELAEVPLYGIDLDDARLAIGDGVDFGNAFVETDGYGRAVTITVDAGTPIWDAE